MEEANAIAKNETEPEGDDLIDIPMIPKDFRIFSCSNYFSDFESYMLYLRLVRLGPWVDKFVFLLIDEPGSGNQAIAPSFAPFEEEIYHFRHKIFFKKANFSGIPPSPEYRWARENKQINDLLAAVLKLLPQPNDYIIISDCDEVPLKEGMDYIMEHRPDFIKFVGYTLSYSFHWVANDRWTGPFAVKASNIRQPLQYYKSLDGPYIPGITLTHCSDCFPTLNQAMRKLKSFANSEYSRYPYSDPSYIYAHAKCGRNLFTNQEMMPNNQNITNWVPDDPNFLPLLQPIPYQDTELVDMKKANGFLKC